MHPNNLEIKTVKINELKPHPKNPRVHPDSALNKLVQSIKEFGWTNPVLVSADGYVLAGHARLKAAEKAGITEVPVIYLPLKGAKAEAYLIADNRLQDETEWDMPKLEDLLFELGDVFTGFDRNEIDAMLINEQPEIATSPKNNKPPVLTMKFENSADVKKMEDDLRELINNKYPDINVSVSCGEV